MNKKNSIFNIFFLFFVFLLQFFLWFNHTRHIKPSFEITPVPPSGVEKAIFSFGDSQFLYRFYAFELQTAGDTFGETVPLKEYDYSRLEKWFFSISELDWNSDYVPSIAGFYYAQSQNPFDNRYIVSYLDAVGDKNPVKFWRWYVYAAYLANHKLRDMDLSIKISEKMMSIKSPDVPAWARAMAIMSSKKTEDKCRTIALAIEFSRNKVIEDILKDPVYNAKNGEFNFLLKAMISRVKEIENDPSLLQKCLGKK